MKHIFHPEAEAEFLEAIDYYEQWGENLGRDFAGEVFATIQRILDYPRAWPVLPAGVRRCQTRRFPYGVVYQVEDDVTYVLAVMHLHRKPGYWEDRLE